MAKISSDTMYGTLNLLILRTVSQEPQHGLDILRRIEAVSGSALRIEEGALYPALHRLERDGLLAGSWGVSDKRRRARFYRLTASGRRQLDREVSRWLTHIGAVARVLGVKDLSFEVAPA